MCGFCLLGTQTVTDRTPAFLNPRDQAEKRDIDKKHGD